MCAVSAVTDYYREKWPVSPMFAPNVVPNVPVTIPMRLVTEAEWKEYQELKRRMAEYDILTGQPHCEKPEVAEWERAIESTFSNQETKEEIK